jgi:hypothetical protein
MPPGAGLPVLSGHDAVKLAMSALPQKADVAGRQLDVRFVPEADIPADCRLMTIKIVSAAILFCRFKRVHGGTVVLSERIQKIGRRAGKGS